MILITIFDDTYRKYAEVLIKSFRKHNPTARVHAVMLNPVLDLDETTLEGAAGRIKVPYLKNTDKAQVLYQAHGSNEERRSYVANLRAHIMSEIITSPMYADEEQFIYMDADSIVRRQLEETICDVSAYSRPMEQSEDLKYLISTIRFKNTPGTRLFLEYWSHETRKLCNESHSIMHCQTAFNRALAAATEDCDALKLNFTFEPAPKGLSDWDFANESSVWAAKGPRKTDPLFVAEAAKYA